jgi:methylated-DNA-[protein]-cysteine S-methyltransferase
MSIRRVDGAYAGSYQSRWGEGWIYVRDGRLVGVGLPGEAGEPEMRPASGLGGEPTSEPGSQDQEALAFWTTELEAYFAGTRTTWTSLEVRLTDLRLGEFERTVYEALLAVPAGRTVSYGELAEMAGYPRAARAVGNAMAANPIPIVVPCHRVIRADGTLGNYGDDPAWKERLLLHEGWTGAGAGAGKRGGAAGGGAAPEGD